MNGTESVEVEPRHTGVKGESPSYFKEALEDAERLLKHAAETGVEVDADTRSAILRARTEYHHGLTDDTVAKLLLALTGLAARLKPVTAASLYACHSDSRPTMRTYLVWAVILSAVIIPASILMFITSNISDAIRTDITTANALVVKLTTELGPPARSDVGTSTEIADLQEYASTVRSIYARSRRLNRFVIPHVGVPPPLNATGSNEIERAADLKKKFELHIPLEDLAAERDNMTLTYQDVRFFAQNIMNDTATFYGALNSCILPILYALLGTCAYLLRTFEDQMGNRTFTPSAANSARFVIAAIGGTVIGLFGGFTAHANASPLALAFLVGYAVEVFFAFLESLIRSFTRTTLPEASSPGIIPIKQ
ncbi:hypothetical protein [Acidicapsa ligni]|uniref:hypothetical protein n=1 Tax=Acidicapsa ligni TaxID=542300 RepID=UPI0021E0D63C|nr:hypothetical protein [Acidicapsa ligni]